MPLMGMCANVEMFEAEQRHEGAVTMTDSKGRKTMLPLEPAHVALVPGLGTGRSAASFASPESNAMLDDDQSDIPLRSRIGLPGTPESGFRP